MKATPIELQGAVVAITGAARGTGVTVSAVMPAAVNTQLTDGIPFDFLPFELERHFILQPV